MLAPGADTAGAAAATSDADLGMVEMGGGARRPRGASQVEEVEKATSDAGNAVAKVEALASASRTRMVLSQVVVSGGQATAQVTPTSFQGLLKYLKISELLGDLEEQGVGNMSDLFCLSQDDPMELELTVDQCNQVTEWQALLQHTVESERP